MESKIERERRERREKREAAIESEFLMAHAALVILKEKLAKIVNEIPSPDSIDVATMNCKIDIIKSANRDLRSAIEILGGKEGE